jgi:hypothetical protein
MTPSETNLALPAAAPPVGVQLAAAFRGGLLLLAGSLLWGLFLPRTNDAFFHLFLSWLPSAWLIFPVGALLGYLLPRWIGRRGVSERLVIGSLVGIGAGLFLAAGFWFVTSHDELIGLWTNRSGGGYASYSYSVRLQLREHARQALLGVAPVTAAWIVAWTLVVERLKPLPFRILPGQDPSPTMHLRLDLSLARVVGWVAAGLAVFATLALLLTPLTTRGPQVPLKSLLIVGPGAVGLVVLGPFLGPLVTGWSFDWAWKYAAVALPVLLISLGPFALCRRPVGATAAVLAWCGFVTALLLWIATGLFSLGRCLG